jgi:hypothetical protein
MRQRLALAAALLAAAGCSVFPHKAYQGPSRPERELSLLKGGAAGEEYSPTSTIDLRFIDGVPQRKDLYFASILPGTHSIGIRATLRIGSRERAQFCAFNLESAAGCTYSPTAPSVPSHAGQGAWEWNVDMVVVVECAGAGGFQQRVVARCGSSDKVFERLMK